MIAVLLGTFAVLEALKSDVLTFGIAVALMLRTVFIVAEDIVGHLPVGVSLAVIVAVLGASVGASLLFSSKREPSARLSG